MKTKVHILKTLPKLTDSIVLEPGMLALRESLLNRSLENSPLAIAQRVETEIARRLTTAA